MPASGWYTRRMFIVCTGAVAGKRAPTPDLRSTRNVGRTHEVQLSRVRYLGTGCSGSTDNTFSRCSIR